MSEMTKASAPKTSRTRARCQHHWVIERPSGEKSVGRCKRCGRQRKFRNVADEGSLGFVSRARRT
jgi:hypothetical protein